MKTFKAICAASVIALSLSIPAYAEEEPDPNKPPTDIHWPGSVNPPGPGNPRHPGTAPAGEIGFPGLADILLALARIF